MKEGYYWATHTDWGERQIVEILEENVYIIGKDRTYKQDEFTDYRRVIREIPNPEDITIEEPKE